MIVSLSQLQHMPHWKYMFQDAANIPQVTVLAEGKRLMRCHTARHLSADQPFAHRCFFGKDEDRIITVNSQLIPWRL